MQKDGGADLSAVEKHLETIYAELGELKRYLILEGITRRAEPSGAWADLMDACEEISARWNGPGAVEEIRSQREK